MKEPSSHSRYAEGQHVFAKINPERGLIIRRYHDRIYYCREVDRPEKEYVYFEREILPFP